MKKKRFDTPATPELYFIENATDARGRRVLVRDSAGPENWIWPPGAEELDKLIGITPAQKDQIEAFFTGEPPGAVG